MTELSEKELWQIHTCIELRIYRMINPILIVQDHKIELEKLDNRILAEIFWGDSQLRLTESNP